MRKKDLYDAVLSHFAATMSDTETELHFASPFQLLVAVVLSAQCTDKRINQVTPRLFHDFPTAEAMAVTSPEVIYEYIRSVSYPNNKARHLVALARMLMEEYGGEVPSDHASLLSLPGVGQKTANVVEAIAFKKAALAVDTHVFRVSHRLALVPASCKTPLSVERELKRHIPENLIAPSHYWLLLHGRYTCTARNPHCDACGLSAVCRWKGKKL
jgi:endonuclease III